MKEKFIQNGEKLEHSQYQGWYLNLEDLWCFRDLGFITEHEIPNLRKANKPVGSAVLENTVSDHPDNQQAL